MQFSPAPWNTTAARTSISTFLCPADSEPPYLGLGGINYRANAGPSVFKQLGNNVRASNLSGSGAFVTLKSMSPADFNDGLSQTAMLSEKPRGSDGAKFRPFVGFWQNKSVWWSSIDQIVIACQHALPVDAPIQNRVGYSWLLPTLRNGMYNHDVPPNSAVPDCTGPGADTVDVPFSGSFAARSYHETGANTLFGDGRVEFIGSGIDLKVWRALGTRDGGDVATGY